MTVISKIQTVIPKVVKAAKAAGGKPLGAASKILGAATLVGVLYDSHVNGKEKAASLEQVNMADRYSSQYQQYMTMEKPSASIAKLKKWWFDAQQSTNLPNIADKTSGYASGFGKTIISSLPLVGLSALALKCKNVGKVAGVLLAANGVKTLLYDVLGVGSSKKKFK